MKLAGLTIQFTATGVLVTSVGRVFALSEASLTDDPGAELAQKLAVIRAAALRLEALAEFLSDPLA